MGADSSDREQIYDVLIRYATAIDTKDWTLFRSCFTADADADYGDIGVWRGVDEITEYMDTTHAQMPNTKHMMSNFAISVDGDEASARSYVHVVLVVTEDPHAWVEAVGEYTDGLVRTADGWQIRRRKFTMTRVLTSTPVP